MTEKQYKIISHIPIYGTIFKMKNDPMFCSPGMADGEYDYILKLIEDYKKDNPDEHVTLKLMKRLIEEDQRNTSLHETF